MRRLGIWIAGAAILVVLLYAVAGFLVLPAVLTKRLADAARGAGYDLKIGALRTNPFTLAVQAEHVQLAHGGAPVLELGRLSASFGISAQTWRSGRLPLKELDAKIGDDGKLTAKGVLHVRPLEGSLDIDVERFPVRAAQTWLSQVAELRVTSGTLSGRGHLAFGGGKAGTPAASYDGSLALRDVALEDTQAKQALLAWSALQSENVKLRIAPSALEIRELIAVKPAGRLYIAEDGNANISRVIRAKTPPSAPQGAPERGSSSGEFPVSVERVTIQDGELDYSDQSLRPQFAAHIHELSGVVNGLSRDRATAARLQLDGRVDQFGSARIRGSINVFEPRALTDLTMSFRNLEMRTFSPYAVKFAGYRIESGKLSADLRYRVRDGELVAENHLVIDKLELGERVESENALDIPLELAVALLRDPQGRIDLGVPIRGNLNDPKFSYAEIAWKALGNLLKKIVSAPFRLLAGLTGAPQQQLDAVVFEPGSARLPPPEREKLGEVAKALGERPQLALNIQGGFDPQADAQALRRIALRNELAKRSGLKVRPGEDPGPLDPLDPKTQRAAEMLFIERYDRPALRTLRASIEAQNEGKSAEERSRAVARAVFSKLLADTSLPQGALEKLAQERQASAREALLALGADPARVAAATPAASRAGKDGVPTKLQLASAER
jgi:hypothetical protein